MAMNIDLKNLNMSDIQDQIKKLIANKKLVTKISHNIYRGSLFRRRY